MSTPTQGPVADQQHKIPVRSTLAGTFGTALEYYDFVLYGLAAALVFQRLFFPGSSPGTALIASFATYTVGFAARPIGGLLLGGIGDRIGRKKILMITVVAMGLSTTLIGALPTFDQVGIAAPILLVALRIIQGLGAGAELSSASTLLVESAPPKNRGLFGSLLCIGTNTGTLLATGVWVLISQLPDDILYSWGWRLPFLVSIFIAAWGLWTRRHVEESKTFQEVEHRQAHQTLRQVYGGVFTTGLKSFVRGLGVRIGEAGTSTIYQVFLVGYIATIPGQTKATGTFALMIASAVAYLSIPLFGWLSDKVGRTIMLRILMGIQLVFAIPGLMMIQTGNKALIVLAFIVGVTVAILGTYGVESAWNAELFGSRYRLAGVTAIKEIGGILGGGIAPFICAVLMARYNHWLPIAIYIAVLSLISVIAAFASKDTRGRDLRDPEDAYA